MADSDCKFVFSQIPSNNEVLSQAFTRQTSSVIRFNSERGTRILDSDNEISLQRVLVFFTKILTVTRNGRVKNDSQKCLDQHFAMSEYFIDGIPT